MIEVEIHKIPIVELYNRESLEAILSADEIVRYRRFKHPRAKLDFLTLRTALRKLLAAKIDCSPVQIEFEYGEHGKPKLTGKWAGSNIEFNTSHTDGLGLIAITENLPIGVDIEKHRTNIEYEKLARRFFSPEETDKLMEINNSERLKVFFNIWTRKEAYLKACGAGLSFPLRNFTVSTNPDEPANLLKHELDAKELNIWSLHHLEIGSSYSAALAVQSKNVSIKIK